MFRMRLALLTTVVLSVISLNVWEPLTPGTAALDDAGLRVAYAQGSLPGLPAGWPTTLQLGKADQPGGAGTMKGTAPFGFRYQYLAGGVNTGEGWATWNTNGAFVTMYADESRAAGMTPVFTYYMLLQSNPASGSDENEQILNNLKNTSTMKAYYADLTLFFQRAAGT
ncbi:MAG: hypothetical protein IT305_18295, partial [Chloroflexi bacterium]|nr:hypothetical protein [Chloroflexota bacterium]